MPFQCDSSLIEKIPKITPPETGNSFNRDCEGTKTIDLSDDKVLLREECH